MLEFEDIVQRAAETTPQKIRQKTKRALPGQQQFSFIEHQIHGSVIPQRPRDGYVNATRLCKTAGKFFNNYHQNKQTKDYLVALFTDTGIPVSGLVQIIKGGNDKLEQGTWVHPQVAIHLAQWLSPEFAVQVTKWIFEWMSGNVEGYMPVHVRRYIKNRAKIPPNHFSMLNEIYLNFLAPLEYYGIVPPDRIMPDISTGRMFSEFLRKKGINPTDFPTYDHEFVDGSRPTVYARLYPLKYLEEFRDYFNHVWLPQKASTYLQRKFPKAVPYLDQIAALPEPTTKNKRIS
ncbi:MAG: KilA-N domain-containing protein [Nitrospira sp. SB0661_bin_20]|nr:KilA-N domain-containing protein [Nitrospira sp. SB0661_bin_20]MYJ22503.1 KilA-N domain-containing protein [Nitrospira sp. SB0673_bin_12]